MEMLRGFIDYFLHLDVHLAELIREYGGWTYGILFGIIFCETGLVVTPFLPGDSLLFAAGALSASGAMNVWLLGLLLTVAAVLGDTVNYGIGARVGTRVFKEDARVLKTEYLRRTEAFYEKYGGKTIIIARFIPIVRTYAPFVAGAARMNYAKFLTYNVVGGLVWVWLFLLAGYFFGNIPAVKDNFGLVIIVIILLSVLPGVYEYFKSRRAAARV
ncbi:MAG TPA: DedA family protein [Longimicrobiaceae bacterium]